MLRPGRFSSLFTALLVVLAASMGVAGCRPKAGRLRVASSIFPLHDLVRRIAGPDADADLLIPPGQPALGAGAPPSAAATIANARVVVLVGAKFDTWGEEAARQNAPKARLLLAADRVPTLELSAGVVDPYVWLDPARTRLVVKAIGEEMARADAGHAQAYRQRAIALDAEIEALDKEIETRVAAWRVRDFADDGAFGYFAERYGLHEIRADSAHPATAGLEPIGGTAPLDSYEKIIRHDVGAIESHSMRN